MEAKLVEEKYEPEDVETTKTMTNQQVRKEYGGRL